MSARPKKITGIKVQQTRNYEQFHRNENQRSYSKEKAERLAVDMRSHGWRSSSVISVYPRRGGGFGMNTGHHRHAAAEMAGVPVQYVIEHKWSAEELSREGQWNERWDVADVASMYAHEGVEDYVILQGYVKRGLKVAWAAALLKGQYNGAGNNSDAFRMGRFKVKTRELADRLLETVERLREVAPEVEKMAFQQAFVGCMACAEIDLDRLEDRIRKNGSMLEKRGTKYQMLEQLEEIYNFRMKEKVPLSFLVRQEMERRQKLKLGAGE